MPQRQFHLRTLLVSVAILCVHFAIIGAAQGASLYILLFSTPLLTMFVARHFCRASMVKSVLTTVMLGPCLMAILFGSACIAANAIARPLPISGFSPTAVGLAGAVFGFFPSMWIAAIWWGVSTGRWVVRDRPDLYYVKDE